MRLNCRLRALRGDRPMVELARDSGVPETALSRIERGIMLPTDAQVAGLERAYAAPVDGWYDGRTVRALRADVLPGQVWAPLDPRRNGARLLVVEVVWLRGEEHAVCESAWSGRTVTVRTDRFRPVRSGYRRIA